MNKELSPSTQNFINELGNITGGSIFVKINEEDCQIEYIRIDDKVYSNPEKMATRIAEYSSKVKEAVAKVREHESFSDLGKHIDPFIIKYHPSWVSLRTAFGLTDHRKDEILCERDDGEDTVGEYIKDNFLAIGINVDYIQKADSLPFSEMVELLFSKNSIMRYISQDEFNHPDFVAFKNAVLAKNELVGEIEGIHFRLGEDGFPLMAIGKKKYDFRYEQEYEEFNRRVASGQLKRCKRYRKK